MSRIEKALEKVARHREMSMPEKLHSGEDISAKAWGDEGAPTISLKVGNPFIVGFTLQDMAVVEEYKKLRSTLIRMTKKDENLNTIMVTSSESGEGKTTTAINLAIVLALEFNHTVLLVDADVRRPMIHNYLGVEAKLGLADCLADGIDVGRALIKTEIPKLSFLSSGKETDVPAELLSSAKMKGLIMELKHRYHDRYIIIDTPPALLFSETQVINSFVDGTIFVVKEGVSTAHVQHALDMMTDGSLLGLVYTNASPEEQSGRYHNHYNRYYQENSIGQDKQNS
jgi:protein-tyrosine kinase